MGRRKTKGGDSPLSFFPSFLVLPCACLVNEELKQQEWRRLRKSHLKSDWDASNFIGAYSISINSSNAGKFFGSCILNNCTEGKKKKKKVVVLCSRSPQNAKSRHFHVVVVQWRIRNVQRSAIHVQSCFFCQSISVGFLLNLLPSLSPLLKLHNINLATQRLERS